MTKKLFLTLTLFMVILGSVLAQERTITGTVTSAEDGAPLPGVNIRVPGTIVGTTSDSQGRYTIRVPSGNKTLEFTFIGMTPQTVAIGTSDVINVIMEVSSSMLEEVVVTALGIQKSAKALGYSQQEVSSAQLTAARETNLTSFLTAKVAGVQVTKTSSGTGGSAAITIRGAKSLLGNNQPLYVIDGVPVTNVGHSSGGTWGD